MTNKTNQNYINHIALVLDSSASMGYHANRLIEVADQQIAHLAQRSKDLDQETRVSVYTFNNQVKCVTYDKDVLRLPSLREHYHPNGMTALVDATLLAIRDLKHTWEGYGEHAFLIYILTDGQENYSQANWRSLPDTFSFLPDHWTVACLVPDQLAKAEVKKFGFPADNVALWDATSATGVIEAGATIRQATERFMTARAQGVRGTQALFSTGADAVNASTVKSNLTPLTRESYVLVPVPQTSVIKQFVQDCGYHYRVGCAYYQLMKSETIQPQKSIAIVERGTDKVYTGPDARALIGLPDLTVRVKPDHNPQYDVFVQSTSVNRKLLPGTRLLMLT